VVSSSILPYLVRSTIIEASRCIRKIIPQNITQFAMRKNTIKQIAERHKFPEPLEDKLARYFIRAIDPYILRCNDLQNQLYNNFTSKTPSPQTLYQYFFQDTDLYSKFNYNLSPILSSDISLDRSSEVSKENLKENIIVQNKDTTLITTENDKIDKGDKEEVKKSKWNLFKTIKKSSENFLPKSGSSQPTSKSYTTNNTSKTTNTTNTNNTTNNTTNTTNTTNNTNNTTNTPSISTNMFSRTNPTKTQSQNNFKTNEETQNQEGQLFLDIKEIPEIQIGSSSRRVFKKTLTNKEVKSPNNTNI